MSFDQFSGTASYIASEDLKHAVNVSVALARPLLVRGEPGTGKTLLAENVARALGLPLLRWHVKSTTRRRKAFTSTTPSRVCTTAASATAT
jgi:MoxR-like ATPase